MDFVVQQACSPACVSMATQGIHFYSYTFTQTLKNLTLGNLHPNNKNFCTGHEKFVDAQNSTGQGHEQKKFSVGIVFSAKKQSHMKDHWMNRAALIS